MYLRIYYMGYRAFQIDEFEHAYSSFLIAEGDVIYRDFFQQHTPLFYLIFQCVFLVFKSSVEAMFACRFLVFLLYLGINIFTFKIANKLFDWRSAIFSVIQLNLCVAFFLRSYEVRTIILSSFFLMVSIFYLLSYYKDSSRFNLYFSGITLCLCFISDTKGILFLPIFYVVLLVDLIKKRQIKRNIKQCIAYTSSFLMPFMILCMYFYYNNALIDFYINCFNYIYHWLAESNSVVHVKLSVSTFKVLSNAFFQNFLMVIFLFLGIKVNFSKFYNDQQLQYLFLCTIIGFYGLFFLNRGPWEYNFILITPLLAIWCGNSMALIFNQCLENKKSLVTLFIIITTIISGFYFPFNTIQNYLNITNEYQLGIMEFFNSIQDKKNYICDFSGIGFKKRFHHFANMYGVPIPIVYSGLDRYKKNYAGLAEIVKNAECKIIFHCYRYNNAFQIEKFNKFVKSNFIYITKHIAFAGKIINASQKSFELFASANYRISSINKNKKNLTAETSIFIDNIPVKNRIYLKKGKHIVGLSENINSIEITYSPEKMNISVLDNLKLLQLYYPMFYPTM